MLKRGFQILLATLSILIGLYPVAYLLVDRRFGLLSTKTEALLASTAWNIGFYTHIFLGGLTLLVGWVQFSATTRRRYPVWHRRIGKVYVISALLSALAGIGIGGFATGGIVAAAGFIALGMIWFYTTLKAYLHIRNGQVEQHQKMMTYSYAACFAAVTLRIWLPLLSALFGNFITAYTIVAWLCWVPNLLVAHQIVKRQLP